MKMLPFEQNWSCLTLPPLVKQQWKVNHKNLITANGILIKVMNSLLD